jgi:Cd(II)/Pb(II)-responsive transcriptional regulator
MRIGELAKNTSCDVETIRYYEKSGLLSPPARSNSGYREYGIAHQEQLQFIRHCRSLQMTLSDIRILLNFKNQPTAECQEVNTLLDHHIERIQQQMFALRTLEKQLTTLRQQCREPHSTQECGILQNLAESAAAHTCACHPTSQSTDEETPS